MSHGLMRTRVMANRPYDHHYDPTFVMSADRMRQGGIPAWTNSVTQVNTGPAAQRSNYRAAPQNNVQFRATQVATVPAIMPDGTIGRMPAPAAAAATAAGTTAAAPAPPRVRGLMGPMSAAQVAGQLASEVRGRSRVKFFKRPVVPYLEAPGDLGGEGEAAAAAQAEAFAAAQAAAASAPPQVVELHRTLGTQSDYRESETQTDPYTPDYITAPDEPEPEILGLAHLTYGAGLPASMSELRLIDRMRDKRAFEASLPPITDASSFERRKQMLEQRELAEWAMREAEIKEEQEERLAVLVATLKARESKIEQLSEARVDLVRSRALDDRESHFEQVHRDRIKLLRGLTKARQNVDDSTKHMVGGAQELASSHATKGRLGLRDIVAEYADHASTVYAPVQREGKLPVKNQVVDYGIPMIANFQGLVELERTLPRNLTGAPASDKGGQQQGQQGQRGHLSLGPDGRIAVPSLATRKGQAIRADLEFVDSLLAEGEGNGTEGGARRRRGIHVENVYKKFEPVQRAPTPRVQPAGDDEQARAILLLQRLLRGRMVQNAMYEGKQHAIDLIRELRIDEDADALRDELEDDPDAPLHHALDTLEGEVIATTLDFASKEVVRATQEAAVANMVKLAELDRRHREVEEAGRRQAGELMRLKRERQRQEVMADHARTADRFVADMMRQGVERYARAEAARGAEVRAAAVEPILTAAEQAQRAEAAAAHSTGEGSSDEPDVESTTLSHVGGLVSDFLLPEVERRREARTRELEDRRYNKLAHEAVLAAVQALQPGGQPAQQYE